MTSRPDAWTVRRAIVALPRLGDAEQIEAVRRRFDPLANVLPAHITLVFPFPATAAAKLDAHIHQAVAGVAPFDIGLTTPTIADAEYLFLDVVSGLEPLVQLHDRLYSGPLSRHLSPTHAYRPHVTIGRLPRADQLAEAEREARVVLARPGVGRVSEIAIFRLDQPTHGSVENTFSLARLPGGDVAL